MNKLNKKQKTVVVGLSGGVDSSVTALLLKKQGYKVIGVFMQNWDTVANAENNFIQLDEKCDAQKDFEDAKAIADKLGIEIYKKDFIKEYWDKVFLDFLDKYKKNLTPNPDIFCNKYIKFDAFLEFARKKFNCDYIATGHYADVKHFKNGGYLKLCKDDNKDQTYFLCHLNNEQLKNTLFPLAKFKKDKVREIAKKYDLITANKKDSTGICFIGERNLVDFLSNYIPISEGDIIDITNNTIVGKHKGSQFYTIGQRKGLNLGGLSQKYFVCKKENNTIYIAPNDLEEQYLSSNYCELKEFNWIKKPIKLKDIHARFRHRQPLQKVDIQLIDNKVIVKYKPQKNIVPGQYCVLYQNKYCLGGGEIEYVEYKRN
ncbi:MAG: tRNA 2-thiouridine(34) synthase MnmA [Ureaplasma sp.]|nr:tRNA 2-thiouridine(34) synthase MnmA [Ureaplasma sp.]